MSDSRGTERGDGVRYHSSGHYAGNRVFYFRKPDYGGNSGNPSVCHDWQCDSGTRGWSDHEESEGERRPHRRNGSRFCAEGIVYGRCHFTDFDSEPDSGSNGSEDGRVPDDIFPHPADYGSDRECVCVYHLDSVKESGGRWQYKVTLSCTYYDL